MEAIGLGGHRGKRQGKASSHDVVGSDAALMHGAIGCLHLGHEGTVLHADPAVAGMMGLDPEALVDRSFQMFVAAKDRPAFTRFIETVFSTSGQFDCDLALVDQAAGSVRDVYCMASSDAQRSICTLTLMEQDAIRSSMPEQDPIDTERCMFRSMRDLYYRTDMTGRVQEVSPSCLPLTGYAKQEVLGRDVAEFYANPEQRRALLEALQRDGHVDDFEVTLVRKDGLIRIASAASCLIRDEDGRPVGVEGILRDITERKLAEHEMHLNMEGLAEAQRIACLGDCELDLATNALRWSAETYRIFEASPQQFGATYEDFLARIHPDDRERVNLAYLDAIRHATPLDIVHRLLFEDGRLKYVSTKGQIIADASGRPMRMRCTIQDVTERKQKEIDALQDWRRRDQLQHEQIAVQTAVAIAHDLNQPLLAISAYCEAALTMLEQEVIDRQKIAGALKASVQQALRAGETIREVLAFLDRRDAPVEELELDREIRDAMAAFERDGEMPLHVRIDIPEDVPKVRVNHLQAHKVLGSLIQNAAEAMGRVGDGIPKLDIRARLLKDSGMVEVSLCDNGPGIDDKDIEAVFEPFYSTKVDGLGMGLTIGRAMIEAWGGSLRAERMAKGGMDFRFTLPAVR